MPSPRIWLISLLCLPICATHASAQTDDKPALIKLKTATMDADGDGMIDLDGKTVRIRAAVTAEYFPALRKDSREYRAYVQDRTGGIRLVATRSKPLRDLVVGVEAEITGTLGQYRGTPFLRVTAVDSFRPSAEIRPLATTLENWDGEALTGQLVTLSGPVFYEDRRYFIGTSEGPRIRLFLRPSKNYVPFISQVRDGVDVHATGIAEQYTAGDKLEGGYRIRPRALSDLSVIEQSAGLQTVLYLGLAALLLGGSWFTWRHRRNKLRLESQKNQRIHALGTMAGGIAHEFNNYLLAIMGFTELARMEVKQGGTRDHLDQVLEAGNRAKALIDQILSFGRSKDIELAPTNVREAVEEAVVLLRAIVPASIAVRTDLHPGDSIIEADRGQLSQLLLNLGTNATHAMPNGGEFTVSLQHIVIANAQSKELSLQPGPHVLLEVSDNGAGMDKETLQRIFDPFFTTRGRTEGTGLGLSVVHGIIKRHNGAVKVDSTPGQGTTFRIFLPIASETTPNQIAAASAKGPVAIPPPPEEAPKPAKTNGIRIMVVDDQDSIVQLVSRLCRSLGYVVTATRDAAEAESMFRSDPAAYQLLITDQTMPTMTGMELSERIRQIAPNVPVLLMTGNTNTVTDEGLFRAGIDSVINKPFGYDELSRHVEQLLAGQPQ